MRSFNFISLLIASALLLAVAQAQFGVCDPPCMICDTGSTANCTSCIQGYSLNGSFCLPTNCQVNYCQKCHMNDSFMCMDCQNNFMLINNECVCQAGFEISNPGSPGAWCQCPSGSTCTSCLIEGCVDCLTATECTTCGTGWDANGNGGCVMCNITNCMSCVVNNFCGMCMNNMTITEWGTCVMCNTSIPGCTACSPEGMCLCEDGYQTVMDTADNTTTCRLCAIAYCENCSADNTCMTCEEGFTLMNNTCMKMQVTLVACQAGCFTCNSTGQCESCLPPLSLLSCKANLIADCEMYDANFTMCMECNDGYMLAPDNMSCMMMHDQHCEEWNQIDHLCTKCINFYVAMAGMCMPCQAGPVCTKCWASDLTRCTACMHGFYLEIDRCMPCAPACLTCLDGFTCTSLKTHEKQYVVPVLEYDVYKITYCPYPCEKCDPFTLSCLECRDDFYYAGNGVCTRCL